MIHPKILTLIFYFVLIAIQCAEPEPRQFQTPNSALASTPKKEAAVKKDTVPQQPAFDLDYLMGKFEPSEHPDFILIDAQYADRGGMYLRKDAYTAFIRMFEAAQKDGIRLQIRSAARNFEYQKGIWERKWTGETKIENGKDASAAYPDPADRARAILLYSSMPGTSRHHWGTDIDLNSFNNDWFGEGEGLRLYTWMRENAHKFGFCQPYSDKSVENRTGYEEERWHWSYMPVSAHLSRQAGKDLKNSMIHGFLGAEVAAEVDMVGNYVLGISSACLE